MKRGRNSPVAILITIKWTLVATSLLSWFHTRPAFSGDPSPTVYLGADIISDLETTMIQQGYSPKFIKGTHLDKFGMAIAHWEGEYYVSLNPKTWGPTLLGLEARGRLIAPVDLLDPIFSSGSSFRPSPYPCVEAQYLSRSRIAGRPVSTNALHEIVYPANPIRWVGLRVPKNIPLDGSFQHREGSLFNFTGNLKMCDGCQANFNSLGNYLRNAENVYAPGVRIPFRWPGGSRVDYVVGKGLEIIDSPGASSAVSRTAPPLTGRVGRAAFGGSMVGLGIGAAWFHQQELKNAYNPTNSAAGNAYYTMIRTNYEARDRAQQTLVSPKASWWEKLCASAMVAHNHYCFAAQ